MAERKSVNKYYPPDWDPSKGSVNKYVGQHPLRDRARKLSQGILVIRFEMPYNIWCEGCNNPIGMGVRYNAEKKKVGNYYSTPIYKFRMKCHLCDNHFEIQTDPKNHDYVIVLGARRKEQRWDPKENEQIETEDKATQKKLAMDAMYKLEHGSDDQQKRRAAIPSLGQIEDRMSQYKDDYMLNKLARNKFRAEKKSIKAEHESDKALLEKSSLDITLVKESEEDIRLAGLLRYRTTETFDEKQVQKRREIESRPLFATPKVSTSSGSSPSDTSLSSAASTTDTNSSQKKRLGLSLNSNKPSPFAEKSLVSKTFKNVSHFGIRRKSISINAPSQSHQPVLTTAKADFEIGECVDQSETLCGSRSDSEHIQRCSVPGLDISPTGIPATSTLENRNNALNSLISEYADSDSASD